MSHKLYKITQGIRTLELVTESPNDLEAMANTFASDHVTKWISRDPDEMIIEITPIDEWNANNG